MDVLYRPSTPGPKPGGSLTCADLLSRIPPPITGPPSLLDPSSRRGPPRESDLFPLESVGFRSGQVTHPQDDTKDSSGSWTRHRHEGQNGSTPAVPRELHRGVGWFPTAPDAGRTRHLWTSSLRGPAGRETSPDRGRKGTCSEADMGTDDTTLARDLHGVIRVLHPGRV